MKFLLSFIAYDGLVVAGNSVILFSLLHGAMLKNILRVALIVMKLEASPAALIPTMSWICMLKATRNWRKNSQVHFLQLVRILQNLSSLHSYNFKVPNSNATSNSTEFEDDVVMNCTNYQSIYIWSDNFVCLLGPRPLLWFTIYAVIVPENSLTIELPCLSHDTYNTLLSRLTYMVQLFIIVS